MIAWSNRRVTLSCTLQLVTTTFMLYRTPCRNRLRMSGDSRLTSRERCAGEDDGLFPIAQSRSAVEFFQTCADHWPPRSFLGLRLSSPTGIPFPVRIPTRYCYLPSGTVIERESKPAVPSRRSHARPTFVLL